MNEQMRIPVQFVTAGNSVRPEKQALVELLMSAVLLGLEAAALAKYMMDKGYKPPSDKEMKACTVYVWKKLLHIQ